MTDLPRNLINEDGEPFDGEIEEIEGILGGLGTEGRTAYRDQISHAVATHDGSRMLVVSGPGSGKSFLFLRRIEYWLGRHDDLRVSVSSFVRKLVKDLESEVSVTIPQEDQGRVAVSTLHALARGIVERNLGTSAHRLNLNIKVIPPNWTKMVWADVLEFHENLESKDYSFDAFQTQFYTEEFASEDGWGDLRDTYFRLGRFYNAVGFADMIVLAREAVEQNPGLKVHQLWIIDEFQDFNRAEEHLIRVLTSSVTGVLIAGDDDQALYQALKASHPEIICSYYGDQNFAKAMLPYCNRCSYFVCKAASAFIAQNREATSIRKIYLPLREDSSAAKVQVIGTAAPASAVDYIEKFVAAHKGDLEAHKAEMADGKETDPFLLILTPIKDARFYALNGAKERLQKLVSEWSAVPVRHSRDYWKVVDYCAAGWNSKDNFAVRKILSHEGLGSDVVHGMLVEALDRGCGLVDVGNESVDAALAKSSEVVGIIESDELGPAEKVAEAKKVLALEDAERLEAELTEVPISGHGVTEGDEGDEALETAGALSPVEMLTLVGAKGLSAKHVIVIGCDDLNMQRTTALTFFVALTRARKTLHLIASLKAGGANAPHGFVAQLPDDCCEYTVHKKTGTSDQFATFQQFSNKLGRLAQGARGGWRRR